MKAGLKKIALNAVSDLNGKEKEREQHDREASRSLLGIIESG